MNDAQPAPRERILQSLAQLLETAPEKRITTAGLAREVGVTEAALYRHFPSKRKMFEGLIEFAEETVFGRCQTVLANQSDVRTRLGQLTSLLLIFAERNPGICRVLTGAALNGEDHQLQLRASHFFDRFETELRQVLKNGEIEQQVRPLPDASRAAAFLMTHLEGRIQRHTRSGFQHPPHHNWEDSWAVLEPILLT